MTIQNFCTAWPLNMPFEIYDHRPGEQALAASALFRGSGLRLLCGVTLSDVTGGTEDEQDGPSLLDYLVCKGDHVLLAVDVANRDPCRGSRVRVPHLPTAETTGEQLQQGDVAGILSLLEEVLQKGGPPVWRCRLQPYPGELRQQLFDAVLLERQIDGSAAPTDYGMCMGLVRVLQNGRCTAMCSPQTAKRLPDFLRKRPRSAPARRQIPFEARCETFRAGLPSNGQHSARRVQEVMDAPLEEYMDGFPEELATLRDSLPQCATYGEAACAIYSMLHSAGLFDEGVALMQLLAVPPLENRKTGNAIQRRVTGGPPDGLPERYQRTGGGGQSFAARAGCFRQKPPASSMLASGTLAGFFQGAGILAQSGYPQWLSNTLRAYLELPARCKYADALDIAAACSRKDGEDDAGIRMLYLLLIEPYLLIYRHRQNRKEVSET